MKTENGQWKQTKSLLLFFWIYLIGGGYVFFQAVIIWHWTNQFISLTIRQFEVNKHQCNWIILSFNVWIILIICSINFSNLFTCLYRFSFFSSYISILFCSVLVSVKCLVSNYHSTEILRNFQLNYQRIRIKKEMEI